MVQRQAEEILVRAAQEPIESSGLQEASCVADRESCGDISDDRAADGRGLPPDLLCSGLFASTDVHESLGGASQQSDALSHIHQSNMAVSRNPRLPSSGSIPRSPSPSCRRSCKSGPGQSGCRQLGRVPGGQPGERPAICSFSEQEAARSSRTGCVEVDRREVVGGLPMEAQGPGQLPRNQEEARTESQQIRAEERGEDRQGSRQRKERKRTRRSSASRRESVGLSRVDDSRMSPNFARAWREDVKPKLPGEGASAVFACRIWDELWTTLCSSRSRLRMFWFAARSNSVRERAAPGKVWPICPFLTQKFIDEDRNFEVAETLVSSESTSSSSS